MPTATLPSAGEPRLRLGFFSYLQGSKSHAEIYAETLELFVAADELGFDVGWVAQHHFGHHGGLPSPFVFFGALGARTKQLGFGTAVITLPIEHPVRVAEDAAVLEAIFPGRLHLGLGTGFAGPEVMATFDHPGGDRRTLYDAGIERVIDAIEGKTLNGDGDVLLPPAPALREHLWEGPSTEERVAESARRGSGLLLSRVAIGAGNRPTPELQIPMVEVYKRELPEGVAPRIGLSRTVYPSRNPDVAFRDLSEGLREMAAIQAARGQPVENLTIEQQFARNNIHWGSPDAVIESLRQEPLIDQTTDLICQVQPGVPSFQQTLEALELIATEVAPALGWHPARAEAVAAR